VLSYDVGGSHVSAAVCYAGDFSLGPIASERHATVASFDAFVDLLAGLGRKAAAGQSPPEGAMLAVPGPFDVKAGTSLMRHKLPYLYGLDLRAALARRLGLDPGQVRFLNDAHSYLLGEVGCGAARGFHRAVALTLGTGIGSGYAVEGRLVTEGAGVPPDGEIWNVPYEGGIVEDFVSSRAVIASYKRRTGVERQVVEIAAVAPNDAAARVAFEELGEQLGRIIRSKLEEFGPDVVVVGGGIARSAELFLPATRRALSGSPIQLRIAALLERAPLVGCGVAWFSE
jgi:predicted NBD/HSP70 family sugar kinase